MLVLKTKALPSGRAFVLAQNELLQKVMPMLEKKNGKERNFWTKDSVKNENYLDGDGGARHPAFMGQECAYGDPRDKPLGKRGRGCPYSREKLPRQEFTALFLFHPAITAAAIRQRPPANNKEIP